MVFYLLARSGWIGPFGQAASRILTFWVTFWGFGKRIWPLLLWRSCPYPGLLRRPLLRKVVRATIRLKLFESMIGTKESLLLSASTKSIQSPRREKCCSLCRHL